MLRRPVVSLVLAGGVMLLAAAPVLGLHIGQSGVSTLPNSLPSKQGYVAVQRLFPNQNPYPVEIVVDGGSATDRADLAKLQATLASETTFGSGTIQTSSNGKLLALTVPIKGAPVSNVDVAAVRNLRTDLIPAAFAGSGTSVYVGGTTAETADYFSAVTSPTLFVLLFVLGLSFVVLMLAFRSLVIAAVSILLNLLSVGAAYGLLTLVFLHGIGAGIFGFHQEAAIDAWVPLFLFAVLFALSMDYQVFLDEPDQGALRRDRLHPRGGDQRRGIHRQDHHRSGVDHHRRLLRLRPWQARHVPADGLRRGRRPAARRDADPHGDPAERADAAGRAQLVPAALARVAAPSRGRVTRGSGCSGARIRCCHLRVKVEARAVPPTLATDPRSQT